MRVLTAMMSCIQVSISTICMTLSTMLLLMMMLLLWVGGVVHWLRIVESSIVQLLTCLKLIVVAVRATRARANHAGRRRRFP